MNMTEKNGQPSMEEILASIRRIIAEEPASQHNGELRGTPIMLKGDGLLEDAGDFDLPAIFRSSPPQAVDRQTPLLGRLTDAIRSATAAQPEGRQALNGSEDYAIAEPVEAAPTTGDGAYPALSSLKPVRPEARAPDPEPVEVVVPMTGPPLVAEPAPPASAAASSSGDEPRRVMAAFKDTHFLRMASPPAAALPPPAAVEPPVAVAPPPVSVTPAAPAPEATQPLDFGAIIPGQLDRNGLLNGVAASSVTAAAPPVAEAAAPVLLNVSPPAGPVVAMPPPPLPPAAAMVPAANVAAPADGVEATDSIEDTTADLLRPMLRQWLADNMPRMVEKALHIEIAESVRAPKKP